MILVTGGTGFIGSHLVERLAEQGRAARCLVRRPNANLPPAVERAYGDLESGVGLSAALHRVDIVIHLAGVTKAHKPADYENGNAVATANLLRACGDAKRFVHVSSLAAAGPSPCDRPLAEADEPRPISHYGRSKLGGELAVRKSAVAARSIIIRPPVVYGPRDRDVYQVLRAAARGWITRIGAAPRRFSHIYVGDLVDGLIAAADHTVAGAEVFYLASESPVTWDEFGVLAARLMGRGVRTMTVPETFAYGLGFCAESWNRLRRKPGILSRDKIREACATGWVCDPAKAGRELGFRASTSLEDGLRRSLAWYKEAGWLKF